jgi:hypothetical protein
MNDMLQFGKEMDKLTTEISAAGGLNNAPATDIERYEKLKAERRKLDRRKVDVLNRYIFPSMANLTVFLEYIAESYRKGGGGYINKIFEEDLEALFFAKSIVDKSKKGASIFWRLINAICFFDANISYIDPKKIKKIDHVIGIKDIKTRPIGNFRLVLCDIMQELINRRLVAAGQFTFNDGLLFINETLGPDMNRARAWTRMLAGEAYQDLKFDKERRPALF